ncbi:Os05g0422900, partial [Oryza sativa Japonica Group]
KVNVLFQVPAMILSRHMLVLSPLLALMSDQLRKLPAFMQDGLFASS